MKAHDMISSLYSIREMINCHLIWLNQQTAEAPSNAVGRRSIDILMKTCDQINRSLEIARNLNQTLHSEEPSKVLVSTSIHAAWGKAVGFLREEGLLENLDVIERIPDFFPKIHCTPNELEEIFYHIAKNACQILTSGKLVIRVQLAFTSREDACALISISDTGRGIPAGRLPFLFEPFYTTKPWGEGNGLGLWIAKKLVQKNKGKISVQSFENCGTTFQIEFPLAIKFENSNGAKEKLRHV